MNVKIDNQTINNRKSEQIIKLKVSCNCQNYHIKVTQELSKFGLGHYRGYIEKIDIPIVQESPTAISDNSIIATFQSTGSPKPKLTVADVIEEFIRILSLN